MKNILLTNDDGIQASGMLRLAKVAQKFGKVWVVAPSCQKSGASHSINLHTPIAVESYDYPLPEVTAFAVEGSPADCVRLAVCSLLPQKPDYLLSGINYGYNAGTDVQYSGTLGAAMEGIFQGVPSIALSEGTEEGYCLTDLYLESVLTDVLKQANQTDYVWNINFPGCPPKDCAGILWNRTVSKSCIFRDSYEPISQSEGITKYMVKGTYQEKAEAGSDLAALFQNYISIGIVKNIGS